jgi:hypothetical protein
LRRRGDDKAGSLTSRSSGSGEIGYLSVWGCVTVVIAGPPLPPI